MQPRVVVSYDHRRGLWRLEAPASRAASAGPLEAPAGYEYDLASVPRPLWWLVAPQDLSLAAPLFHDLIYTSGGSLGGRRYTRAEADRVLLDLMREEGVPRWRRALAYAAVRLFGWLYWGRR